MPNRIPDPSGQSFTDAGMSSSHRPRLEDHFPAGDVDDVTQAMVAAHEADRTLLLDAEERALLLEAVGVLKREVMQATIRSMRMAEHADGAGSNDPHEVFHERLMLADEAQNQVGRWFALDNLQQRLLALGG